MVDFNNLWNCGLILTSIPLLRILDKNGHFYHVVQRASGRDNIYDGELAKYRHNLLCRLCAMHNVVIVFSVTMTNHSHDILMAEKWEDISTVMRLLNSSVAHYVKKKNAKRYTNGRRVFESRPYYRVIKDIVDLFVTGKYIFDNAKQIEDKGGFVPFSCFWTMSRGILVKPYDRKLYTLIFNMTETEICKLYLENDISTVHQIATTNFGHWTTQDNARLFKVNPDIPWLETEPKQREQSVSSVSEP